jgi:argininosuccinate lyase
MDCKQTASRFAPAYLDAVVRPGYAHMRLDHMQRVDRAHVVMLTETGLIRKDAATALLNSLASIDSDLVRTDRIDAGPHEDLFFLREHLLIEAVGPEVGGSLHLARSRNDLEATMFRLGVKERVRVALRQLLDMIESMLTLAERERATLIVAYTHGQPAQPSTLGHYLAAIIEVQLRHMRRLLAAYADVDLCPLGAAAITTTGFAVDRGRVADLLGFRDIQENAYGCIAGVDYLTATFSALKLSLLDMGRFCQDLAFWCGFEVAQLRAPDGFVQISSIMPQKRNPLAIEHARTLASIAAGQCQTVIDTVHNAPFADMVDAEAPTQQAGQVAFQTFGRVTSLLAAFVAGLTVNADNVRRNIDTSCITMTELADSLVRKEGIPFRTAHHITSELARVMLECRISMTDLTVDLLTPIFEKHAGRLSTITDNELQHLVSPEHFVAVRTTYGGPAAATLLASLERYRTRLDTFIREIDALEDAEAAATTRLDDAVTQLQTA